MHYQGQKKTNYLAARVSVLAMLGVFALAGCSTVTNDKSLQCPEVLILSDGAELVSFTPGKSATAQNIAHEELFNGFKGTCEHNIDDGIMSIEIIPQFISTKGPANSENTARFEYFVALSDSNNKVINKQRFPVTLTYPEKSDEMVWNEDTPVTLTLPLKEGESAAKWRIFLGLQLSREELQYIKANR